MRSGADVIADERVRAEFGAPLSPSPRLRRLHEGTTNATPTRLGLDVPALEIGDTIRLAVLGVIANRQLGEPDPIAVRIGRDQDLERLVQCPREILLDLAVVRVACLRPQSIA